MGKGVFFLKNQQRLFLCMLFIKKRTRMNFEGLRYLFGFWANLKDIEKIVGFLLKMKSALTKRQICANAATLFPRNHFNLAWNALAPLKMDDKVVFLSLSLSLSLSTRLFLLDLVVSFLDGLVRRHGEWKSKKQKKGSAKKNGVSFGNKKRNGFWSASLAAGRWTDGGSTLIDIGWALLFYFAFHQSKKPSKWNLFGAVDLLFARHGPTRIDGRQVLPGSIGLDSIGHYLLGFPGFYMVLLGFTGFYWVLLSFTWFYWVFIRFNWFTLCWTG